MSFYKLYNFCLGNIYDIWWTSGHSFLDGYIGLWKGTDHVCYLSIGVQSIGNGTGVTPHRDSGQSKPSEVDIL